MFLLVISVSVQVRYPPSRKPRKRLGKQLFSQYFRGFLLELACIVQSRLCTTNFGFNLFAKMIFGYQKIVLLGDYCVVETRFELGVQVVHWQRSLRVQRRSRPANRFLLHFVGRSNNLRQKLV